jgi:uncharacterized membrane protein
MRGVTSLLSGFRRGVAAGAAGTTALNAATQADMALRARPASGAPAELVSAAAERLGVDVPGGRGERPQRLEGLGALAGTATGLAVGGVAGVLRAAGVRLPAAVGGPLLGAAAMAASDLPMARLGVSDPRTWSAADWAADAVPHLVYGVTTHAVLAAGDDRTVGGPPAPSAGALVRAGLLGAATGCRSTVGLTALALRARRTDARASSVFASPSRRAVPVLATLGEMAGDKSPVVPDRTSPGGLAPRIVLASAAADIAAHRDRYEGGPPAVAAALAAVGTAVLGQRLRGVAQQRFGSDLPGALIEDVVAAGLAWVGAGGVTRGRTHPAS